MSYVALTLQIEAVSTLVYDMCWCQILTHAVTLIISIFSTYYWCLCVSVMCGVCISGSASKDMKKWRQKGR